MARRNESIFEILMDLPWWVSVIVSGAAYWTLAIYLPSVAMSSLPLQSVSTAISRWAPHIAFFFLLPAPISAFKSWRKRRLLDAQKGIQSIRELSWNEFEELVAEAYRRQGFTVMENRGAGADGGVDIRLNKSGQRHLVQCKQWKAQKVGVNVVREMFGLVTAEKAASASVICSGTFTQEARNFADGKAIDLVDGTQLALMIAQVQSAPNRVPRGQPEAHEPAASLCPQCGGVLVLRTAKKGANAGGQFYGCSSYPKCRHTQERLR